MKKRILFLLFSALAFMFAFGLGGVTAHHDGYNSGYGNSYGNNYYNQGYGNNYYNSGYGNSYGGTYSSHVIKSSPYYNYEKTVYRDPWSYRSTIRKVNYGYGSYSYPGYNSNRYYNPLGNYFDRGGYHPPQYVYSSTYRSYY